MEHPTFEISREKHLDHLVKVVPLIVLAYALQCYILFQMDGPVYVGLLIALGGMLIMMIMGLVFYDVNHKVVLMEDRLEVSFKGNKSVIAFHEIKLLEVHDPQESFGTVRIVTAKGKVKFYFVDDAQKIKQWIDSRKESMPVAA
jgi:hypothetical protein